MSLGQTPDKSRTIPSNRYLANLHCFWFSGASDWGIRLDANAFDKYIGFRDVDKELGPDLDTGFPIGSTCEGFIALGIPWLVTDGEIHWIDRDDTVLEDLRHTNTSSSNI
ncbi:peptidase Pab87 C-terminal [Fusarium sp. NRRL 25303]|nr:peptidase Pab87 C-terminal [Fusarium sp. NRRL 25303]